MVGRPLIGCSRPSKPKWPGADWPRLSKPAEQLVNPSQSPQTVAEVPKEAADACSPRRRAIRHRHSVVDEGRGGRVVGTTYIDLPKILVSPQSFWNCPHFGKLREICRPFFDLNNEKWNPQIPQRIARKSLNSPPPSNESCEIRAILVKSYQSLLPICTPTFFTANLAKFAQFANTQSERCEINQFRTNLNKSSILIFRLS